MPAEEIHYRLLKLLEERPELTQRELAGELGVSLGKANYCLRSLIEKGWVKAENFRNSHNKLAYAYILTPSGIARKIDVTRRFLKRKQEEYERLRREIAALEAEVDDNETRHAAGARGAE